MKSGRLGGWLAAGACVAAAGAVAWALWPSNPATAPQARHYLNVTACLLTDSRGIAPGTPGAPAWAAMQNASLATHVMVSYLPDSGPGNATVMLDTLVQRHCGVIITTGAAASQPDRGHRLRCLRRPRREDLQHRRRREHHHVQLQPERASDQDHRTGRHRHDGDL
jgi:hypothetical protein